MANLPYSNDDGVSSLITDTPPTHYIVKIQSFSQLMKHNIEKFISNEFEAGGYKWKLVLYPNGNKSRGVTDHISLYLMIVGGTLLQRGWQIDATFQLFLLDQNKNNYLTIQDAERIGRSFHEMRLQWGFDRFIAQAVFNDPSKGYLVNDTCVFGAEVYVCQEKHTGKVECLSMIEDPLTYKHTWRIENFSNLTQECEESKPFNAADQKWKIQLYPKGKASGAGNYLSLYLALAEPENISPTTTIYTKFTLRVIDQLHGLHDIHEANHWFSASNPSSGWPRFIYLVNFFKSGWGSLVKDCCIVEADVIIHGVVNVI